MCFLPFWRRGLQDVLDVNRIWTCTCKFLPNCVFGNSGSLDGNGGARNMLHCSANIKRSRHTGGALCHAYRATLRHRRAKVSKAFEEKQKEEAAIGDEVCSMSLLVFVSLPTTRGRPFPVVVLKTSL